MLEHYLWHVEKHSEFSEAVSSIQPDSQPANVVYQPYLKVFMNQLSQKQTLSICNWCINFATVKVFSWLRHCPLIIKH